MSYIRSLSLNKTRPMFKQKTTIHTITLIITLWGLTRGGTYRVGVIYDIHQTDKDTIIRLLNYTRMVFGRKDSSLALINESYVDDIFSMYECLCKLLSQNVVAIITWGTSSQVGIQAEILTEVQIPLISAIATSPYLNTDNRRYLIRLAPTDTYQAEAIFDILTRYRWYRFSILASDDDYGLKGTIKLQELATKNPKYQVATTQYFIANAHGKNVSNLDISKELNIIKESLSTIIILNTHSTHAKEIFRKAKEEGLMEQGYSWIITDGITSLPQDLLENGKYPPYLEGILGTVPTLADTVEFREFKADFLQHGGEKVDINIWTAIFYDAVVLLSKTFEDIGSVPAPTINCSNRKPWKDGLRILSHIKKIRFIGVSGEIYFQDGVLLRNTYSVQNFRNGEFVKVSTWSKDDGLGEMASSVHFLGNTQKVPEDAKNTLSGQHLIIGIIEEHPFAFKNLSQSCVRRYNDPDCWYGINIDVNNRLSRDVNFTYELREPSDGKYGSYNATLGSFTGLIDDLMERRISVASCFLTINTERSRAVDFLAEVFDSLVTSVYVMENSVDENPFFFLNPLELTVWFAIITVVFILGIFVTILDKISPLSKDVVILRNTDRRSTLCQDSVTFTEPPVKMSFASSVMGNIFVVASGFVGREGGDGIPDSPAARLVLVGWWFFTTIVISMYTANLTVFLTSNLDKQALELNDLTDIMYEKNFYWGIIPGTSTEFSLFNMNSSDYRRLLELPQRDYPGNAFHAINRTKLGNYLFIYDDSTLTYHFRHVCNATLIKHNEFPRSGLSYAVPKNAPYKDLLSKQLLNYSETGFLRAIKNEWYQHDGYSCTGRAILSTSRPFNIQALWGIFMFLGGTAGLGCVLIFAEFLYKAYEIWRSEPKLPYITALRLSLSIHSLNKLDSDSPFPLEKLQKRDKTDNPNCIRT